MRNYSVPLPAQEINNGEAWAEQHDKTMFAKRKLRRSRSIYLNRLSIHTEGEEVEGIESLMPEGVTY